MKPPVCTTVQPAAADHPRAGQSGYITSEVFINDQGVAIAPADDEVAVHWDSDSKITLEKLAALNVRQS